MKKLCSQCQHKRDIKFFSSNRKNAICNDCKHKNLRLRVYNSPKAVNKRKDDEWSRLVKERAGFKCEYCGKKDYLNSHHIFSRSNRSVRWDLDNGICLDSGCHVFSSVFSAHKTPAEFVEFIKDKRGEEWYQSLRVKAKSICKNA